MKRSFLATLSIGVFAAAAVVTLQKFGFLLRPERALDRLLFSGALPNGIITPGNYVLVVLLSFAVAWTMLQIMELSRRAMLLILLIGELIGAAWVLALADIYFQPLPGILVALLATGLAAMTELTEPAHRRRALTTLFQGRLANREILRLTESEGPDLSEPQAREVSFVFCEIANQAELIDEMPPADCASLTNRFIALASEMFLKEGGYLHGADGEGIRVVLVSRWPPRITPRPRPGRRFSFAIASPSSPTRTRLR
ncbi:MAG: hypothetical protein ABI233_07155 [Chthoniobacterales bacterium]